MQSARPVSGSKLRGTLINLAILGITGTLCLVFGEVAARVVYSDVSTTSRHSDYFSQRWYARHPVRRNSFGFREREFSPVPDKGIYRIAVVGDSVTFGQGLLDEARMTNLLQSRLNAKENAYEVLNFGRPGAETIDQLDTLRADVLPAQPDFILLQWYVNDVEGRNKGKRPPRLELLPIDKIHGILWRRSALYVVAQLGLNSLLQTVGTGPSYAEYMADRFGDPKSEAFQAYDEVLSRFIETAKAATAGTGMGMLLYPRLSDYRNGQYAYDYLHGRVLDICARHEIECLDLTGELAAVENQASLAVNRLDGHPSALANEIMTEAVLRAFAGSWRNAGEPGTAD